MLIDLHTHSYPMSDDSFVSVDELIVQAKALGLDGICLTDHDAFWPLTVVQELSRRHNFVVLPGSEVNTDAGHTLVFGLECYEFGLHKPPFLRQRVKRRQGAMIAAHPYRRRFLAEPGRRPEARAEMLKRAAADDYFGLCDAVEGVNGRGKPEENAFSRDLAAALKLPATGGSDAHRASQLGTAATRFERPVRSLGDLVAEIRAGRFRPEVIA